jgi:hypothetical protein
MLDFFMRLRRYLVCDKNLMSDMDTSYLVWSSGWTSPASEPRAKPSQAKIGRARKVSRLGLLAWPECELVSAHAGDVDWGEIFVIVIVVAVSAAFRNLLALALDRVVRG